VAARPPADASMGLAALEDATATLLRADLTDERVLGTLRGLGARVASKTVVGGFSLLRERELLAGVRRVVREATLVVDATLLQLAEVGVSERRGREDTECPTLLHSAMASATSLLALDVSDIDAQCAVVSAALPAAMPLPAAVAVLAHGLVLLRALSCYSKSVAGAANAVAAEASIAVASEPELLVTLVAAAESSRNLSGLLQLASPQQLEKLAKSLPQESTIAAALPPVPPLPQPAAATTSHMCTALDVAADEATTVLSLSAAFLDSSGERFAAATAAALATLAAPSPLHAADPHGSQAEAAVLVAASRHCYAAAGRAVLEHFLKTCVWRAAAVAEGWRPSLALFICRLRNAMPPTNLLFPLPRRAPPTPASTCCVLCCWLLQTAGTARHAPASASGPVWPCTPGSGARKRRGAAGRFA